MTMTKSGLKFTSIWIMQYAIFKMPHTPAWTGLQHAHMHLHNTQAIATHDKIHATGKSLF